MNEPLEYMCMECGISHYIDPGAGLEEEVAEDGTRFLRHTVCSVCGGPLALRGRAEEEPSYRVET